MPTYEIIEAGHSFQTIDADSADEALELCDEPDADDYNSPRHTTWIEWTARNVDDADDHSCRTWRIEATPPACEEGREHEWQEDGTPACSGGGLKWMERCRHCGLEKHTDTWATRPTDGRQGVTEIEYSEPDLEIDDDDDDE